MLTDQPVIFMDVRHYVPEEDDGLLQLWFPVTYFANKSYDPKENLKDVTLSCAEHLRGGGM